MMEVKNKNQSNVGCLVGIGIALALVAFLASAVYLNYNDASAAKEQRQIQAEANAAERARLNADIKAYEKRKRLMQAVAKTDGVAAQAEREVVSKLRAKYGDSYELTAVDYYAIHKARVLARVATHKADLDTIYEVELKRYNQNRMIIGLPHVTAEELYSN